MRFVVVAFAWSAPKQHVGLEAPFASVAYDGVHPDQPEATCRQDGNDLVRKRLPPVELDEGALDKGDIDLSEERGGASEYVKLATLHIDLQ